MTPHQSHVRRMALYKVGHGIPKQELARRAGLLAREGCRREWRRKRMSEPARMVVVRTLTCLANEWLRVEEGTLRLPPAAWEHVEHVLDERARAALEAGVAPLDLWPAWPMEQLAEWDEVVF